jgi:hypothetical protein
MSEKNVPPRDPTKAIDWMLANISAYAKAKAERVYLEEWRKSKKALLMKACSESSIAAQEREAYAAPEYQTVLKGIQKAVEDEQTLRWGLVAAQARVEIWRTESANNRMADRATQ